MSYQEYDDDEDYYHHHSSLRRPVYGMRRSSQFLDAGNTSGLFRTRSTGARPIPQINIYNDQIQDSHSRTTSPYGRPPPMVPQPGWQQAPPQQIPVAVPQYLPYPVMQAPENRGRSSSRGRWDHELVEDIAELAIRDRIGRSRSRGRSDLTDSSEFMRWQREQKERDVEEATRRQIWEKDNELKRIKADAKAKDDQERVIREYEDKKRVEADRQKVEAMRIKEKIEREEAEAKKAREELKAQIKRDEQAAKDKREREYAEFKREEKEKKDKEEAEKKARKDELETEMRRRLANVGYTQRDIDKIVDDPNAKNRTETTTTTTTLQTFDSRQRNPVFVKINRKYLEIDTLRYYEVPYEVDETDPSFFIILREIDKYETECLFEHTKRLRSGRLLIEGKKDEKKYAFYRTRGRSTSRARKVGILKFQS